MSVNKTSVQSAVLSESHPGPASPYHTIAEAAVYLKTTEWAVAQAIRSGDLCAKKIGKRFVTTATWLDEWFERSADAA